MKSSRKGARKPNRPPNPVVAYYDAVASSYSDHYRAPNRARGHRYPQSYFRLQLLLQRLGASNLNAVYEVGTGEGTPLALLARSGFRVAGCDISRKMVEQTRRQLRKVGVQPSRVQWGDIHDPLTISNQLELGPFDAVVAFGVMPHVMNDRLVLRNIRMFLRSGGKAFIEFRNKLFSLFTFNRHTKEFIIKDLLEEVADDIKVEVEKALDARLEMGEPPLSQTSSGRLPRYDTLPAKFHNPFEIKDLLEEEGFGSARFHWYHYHPAPPFLERRLQRRFWAEAGRLEHNASSWKGYFLCSACVVEADVT